MTIEEKIEGIENKIKRHEYNFFVLGQETISKPELEILKVELYNLKKMKIEESPTHISSTQAQESDSGENLFEFYDGI